MSLHLSQFIPVSLVHFKITLHIVHAQGVVAIANNVSLETIFE